MPTLEEFIQQRITTDHLLAFLVLTVALCCLLLIRVWRVRIVRAAAADLSDALIPAVALISGVQGATSALLLAQVSTYLRLPKVRPGVAPALILLLAFFTRLPLLTQALWYDEAFTATVASLQFHQLPGAIASDVHPPLFYMLTWAWAQTGATGWMLRVPDMAFGLLTIPMIYRLARKMSSERVALTAAFLCTLTPAAIYYSVEARSYALLTLLVFAALLALLERRLTLFALLTALLPALHNLGWFYAVVLCVLGLAHCRWRVIIPLAFSMPLALPCLLLALAQSSSMTDGYWLQWNLAQPLWLLLFNLQVVHNEHVVPVVLPYIAVTLLSLWVSRKMLLKNPAGRILTAFMLGVPALVTLASMVWQPLFLHRAFLPISLLLLIPLAYALNSAAGRYFRPIVASAGILALISFYATSGAVRPDYRALIEDGCGGAGTIYATSIQAAFVARANSDRPVILWEGAVDNGETMTIDDMPAYGFSVGQPELFSCIILMDSPRTAESERRFIREVLATRPLVRQSAHEAHEQRQIKFYVVLL